LRLIKKIQHILRELSIHENMNNIIF
jgi:hypothetical protein